MSLPPSLNTVTPLSKYLAMAIFIIFPFVGFYLGYQYALKSFIPPKPVILYIQITPTPTKVPLPTPLTGNKYIKNGSNLWVNLLEVKTISKSTHFIIDYIESNPCWTPGGPLKPGCTNDDLYLNKIAEQIDISLSPNAKLYYCNGTTADTEVPLETITREFQNYESPIDYFLDIKNNQITAIYQRCLP